MNKLITLVVPAILAVAPVFSQEKKTPPAQKADEIFSYVEQMPEPGFNVGEYLSNNLVYPKDAQRLNKQGRVVVNFVVMKSGRIDSVRVINSVFPSLDSTAVSVVKKMPKWKPGMNAGKPVPVYFTLPIKFTLKD